MEIVDDAFLVLVKEYYVDPETQEVSFFRVKDLVRGDPVFMRIVADKRGVRGGRYKTCLIHRDEVHSPGQEGNCEVCGGKMHEVHYVNMAGSGKTQYYIEGEVLHVSKYQPSKTLRNITCQYNVASSHDIDSDGQLYVYSISKTSFTKRYYFCYNR